MCIISLGEGTFGLMGVDGADLGVDLPGRFLYGTQGGLQHLDLPCREAIQWGAVGRGGGAVNVLMLKELLKVLRCKGRDIIGVDSFGGSTLDIQFL